MPAIPLRGNPYPAGDERIAINAAMGCFVSKIEHLMSEDMLLFAGIKNRNQAAIKSSINNGANVNFCDWRGTYLIEYLCNYEFKDAGTTELVQLMLDHGLDVNASPSIRFSLLGSSDSVVEFMAKKGFFSGDIPSINAKNNTNNTLIGLAITGKSPLPIVKSLIASGADVNQPIGDFDRTPLEIVMLNPNRRNIELVNVLIEAGATVTEKIQELVDRNILTCDLVDIINDATMQAKRVSECERTASNPGQKDEVLISASKKQTNRMHG
jgi:ankyrin repeat protein